MDSNTDSLEATELSAAEKKRTKKGGKAKGTLETSVEIRNRMIGMSEAGLSTMSIALAINRSVWCFSYFLQQSVFGWLRVFFYIFVCE